MMLKKEKKKTIEELYKDKCRKTIEGIKFGSELELSSDEFIDVMFKNCTFDKLTLINIKFKNAIFINCTFRHCKFEKCHNSYNGYAVFDKCFIILSDFQESAFNNTWICDTRLKEVRFIDSSFRRSVFYNNCYYFISFIDNCDLCGACFLRSSGWLDISFKNENSFVKMDANTRITSFNYKDLHHRDGMEKQVYVFESTQHRDIANTFMNFANQFLKNDVGINYGECYYNSKLALHKELKWYEKPGSWLIKMICGYGEKWTNGILFSFGYILFNAIIYMFNGLEASYGKIIDYNFTPNLESPIFTCAKLEDFGECLYFSMMTFTTVGYGNSQAIGFWSRTSSFFEMFFGIIITALITGTILRKLFR